MMMPVLANVGVLDILPNIDDANFRLICKEAQQCTYSVIHTGVLKIAETTLQQDLADAAAFFNRCQALRTLYIELDETNESGADNARVVPKLQTCFLQQLLEGPSAGLLAAHCTSQTAPAGTSSLPQHHLCCNIFLS